MAQGDEVGQLWEQLRQKDAQILMLQKKLQHFRTWLGSVNTRVQQMNPSAVRNARKLYIGGGCSQQLSTTPLLMPQCLSGQRHQGATACCSRASSSSLYHAEMHSSRFRWSHSQTVHHTPTQRHCTPPAKLTSNTASAQPSQKHDHQCSDITPAHLLCCPLQASPATQQTRSCATSSTT